MEDNGQKDCRGEKDSTEGDSKIVEGEGSPKSGQCLRTDTVRTEDLRREGESSEIARSPKSGQCPHKDIDRMEDTGQREEIKEEEEGRTEEKGEKEKGMNKSRIVRGGENEEKGKGNSKEGERAKVKGEEGGRNWTQKDPKSGRCHDTSKTEEPQSDPRMEKVNRGVEERIARWEREGCKVKEERGEERKQAGDPTSPRSFTELWWKTRTPSWNEITGTGTRMKGVRGRGGSVRGVGGRGKRERERMVTGEEGSPGTPKVKRLGGKLKDKTEKKKLRNVKEKIDERGPGQTSLREYFTVYSKIVRKESRQSPENIGALRRNPTNITEVGDQTREGRDLAGSKEVKKKLIYLEKELTAGPQVSRGPPRIRLQGEKVMSRGGKK